MELREILLGRSVGYQSWKRIIGADAANEMVVREYIKPVTGESILDVGCGVGDMAPLLSNADYVGFDVNGDYIEQATERYGTAGRFIHAGAGDLRDLGLAAFDKVICVGILHHLDDEQVADLMSALPAVMKPGAPLIAIENAWDPEQAATARVLLALDRGRFVRSVGEYERLISAQFEEVHSEVRHDFLRIPYTNVITTARRPA